jgi:hypothetical protein
MFGLFLWSMKLSKHKAETTPMKDAQLIKINNIIQLVK